MMMPPVPPVRPHLVTGDGAPTRRRRRRPAMLGTLWLVMLLLLAVQTDRPMVLAQKSYSHENNPSFFNIGGVLSTNDSETHFSTIISVRISVGVGSVFGGRRRCRRRRRCRYDYDYVFVCVCVLCVRLWCTCVYVEQRDICSPDGVCRVFFCVCIRFCCAQKYECIRLGIAVSVFVFTVCLRETANNVEFVKLGNL